MTTHELTDDGTLDTVLKCTGCGAESRYNFQSVGDEYPQGEEGYNAFIEWALLDADEQHECHEGDGHGHQGWVIVNLANGRVQGEGWSGHAQLYVDLDKARERAAELRAGDELHAMNDSLYVYALAPVDPGHCQCGRAIPTSTSELQA